MYGIYQLLLVASAASNQLATIALLIVRPSVHPFVKNCNSSKGDTAKSTGLIYFMFVFNVRSFAVDNACLFHFVIVSVMSVETDKKQTVVYCIS